MSQPSEVLRCLCETLREKGLTGDVALVHEAAVDAWGLDNNLVPYGLDLAAASHWSACKVAERLADPGARVFRARYDSGYAWRSAFQGIPLRVWPRYAGVSARKLEVVENAALGVRCANPYTVLQHLPESPDIMWLYEIRAALAACLYVDEMPADQLRRFIEYVRPC